MAFQREAIEKQALHPRLKMWSNLDIRDYLLESGHYIYHVIL